MTTEFPDLDLFRQNARVWLESNATPRPVAVAGGDDDAFVWGAGSDNVAATQLLKEVKFVVNGKSQTEGVLQFGSSVN